MKKPLLILFSTLFALSSQVRAQCDWWAKSFGDSSDDHIHEMARDAAGNIYATGSYSGSINFGSTTLNSEGDKDIFLVKISQSGNVLWAKSAGGMYQDEGYSVAVDGAGNVYLGGQFYGTADFSGNVITSATGEKGFLAKYDSNGNIQWARSVSGSITNSIATFGTKVYFVSKSYTVIEYNNAGTAIDAFDISDYNVFADKIRTDASGNIIIGGTFYSGADFGNGIKSAIGSSDVFILKLSASKTFSWVQTGGGSASEFFHDLELDNLGNIIFSCSFEGSVNFNGSVVNSPSVSGQALGKFTGSGAQSWVRLSGTGTNQCCNQGLTSIAVDGSNNIYHFTNKNYYQNEFNGINFPSSSGSGVLARYDNAGTMVSAVPAGQNSHLNKAIVINSNGKLILGETFSYTTNFGSKKLMSGDYSSDLAIVKLDQLSDLTFIEPSICVVDIDAVSKKNKIVWSSSGMANVDYFSIYKENKIGEMQKIGQVNFGQATSFVDAGSNPVEREYVYKLTLTDICGNEFEAQEEHKTIHLQMYKGPGNRWSLQWTEYYGLQIKYYRIYRGTTENNMAKFDSIGAISNTWTDVNPPVGDVYYKVEAVAEDHTCGNNPSSNRISNNDLALSFTNGQQNSWFNVFPNPANDKITISSESDNARYSLYDIYGKVIMQGKMDNSSIIDISSLAKGVYHIQLDTESGLKGTKKLVVN